MRKNIFAVISFSFCSWLSVAILAFAAIFLILVKDQATLELFSDILSPITLIMAAAAMLYAWRVSVKINPTLARSWLIWLVGLVMASLASVIWAVYELIIGKSPFPSIADLLYVSGYLLILWGLIQYTRDGKQTGERKSALLDNLIVVFGAGLSFWVFLFKPAINVDGFALSTFLELFYPILGMVSLWTIMIFFRTRIDQSQQIPLIMIAFAFVVEIAGDVGFAYQSLHGIYRSGTWFDFLYMVSSLAFMLAAVWHADALLGRLGKHLRFRMSFTIHPAFNRWPVYLPYLWLAVAFGLLVIYLPVHGENLILLIAIGIIIGLVILRQVLTLNDNERLYKRAMDELKERRLAQDALVQANLELDDRVEKRTNDLRDANDLLTKYNQKVETSLKEKDILLKEIHHRVKNNLQIVSSLLSLQTRLVENEADRSVLQDSQMRVRSMALIHERLYRSDSLAEVQMGSYIESLAPILFQSYQADAWRVKLITRIDDISVGIDAAVPIGLILNEMISNALKHAFPDGRQGQIVVELRRAVGGDVVLVCQDDGQGLPPGQDIRTSHTLGLQLVNNLTRQLDGEINIENQNGVKISITFPSKISPVKKICQPGELTL